MGCNWGKLLEQNRCKAIGVPWSDSELNAIYKLKIPADFVRNGCLTLANYKKATAELERLSKASEEKPLKYMNKPELMNKAGELGISVTPDVTKVDLIQLIEEQSKLLAEKTSEANSEQES